MEVCNEAVKGFLKAEGKKLVNGEGREILLRGVGLGSWLLPEGYMWRFPEKGDRPRRIEQMIKDLVGNEKAEIFWENYYEGYISEEDIKKIAQEGFNSIRIPINWSLLIEKPYFSRYNEHHFQLLDRIIEWCKKYSIYVILDMHGAPGGQTGTNIDDSENDRPELFEEEANKLLTIDIWRKLAQRYADQEIVGGYDLLNEPLPQWFSKYNNKVMPLYKHIIEAIREVDKKHLIILEGVHWATDWSIFDEKADDNLMLQFHKYWNNPDCESIKVYLEKREELEVPIFMGEGGENNKEWYAGAFKLYEQMGISWNFWTWKKMDTTNSPCSIIMPSEWNKLVEYLEGGSKPSTPEAERILWEYLNNIKFENCNYHSEVVNALFSRPTVTIPAAFYDYKGMGLSHWSGSIKSNKLGFRDNDKIEIGFVDSIREKPNFEHVRGQQWQQDELLCIQLSEGAWVNYEINIKNITENSVYSIEVFGCSPFKEANIKVSLDGILIGEIRVDSSEWKIYRIKSSFQPLLGKHTIKFEAPSWTIKLGWIKCSITMERGI